MTHITQNTKPALWFIFKDEQVALLSGAPQPRIPLLGRNDLPSDLSSIAFYLGTFGRTDCFVIDLPKNKDIPCTMQLYSLRSLLPLLPHDLFSIAGKAKQLVFFHKTNRYCGKCGSVTRRSRTEDARICLECSQVIYPRLSPVVIMTVAKHNQLLLARSPHFPEKMYSCLAGFIEPGETAEEAVAREVMEETQISVKNIQYIASQPWPFPHSLMFGYSSEYDGGKIIVDNDEIEDAAWFSKNNLPQLPPKNSIAGHLITLFLSARSSQDTQTL